MRERGSRVRGSRVRANMARERGSSVRDGERRSCVKMACKLACNYEILVQHKQVEHLRDNDRSHPLLAQLVHPTETTCPVI